MYKVKLRKTNRLQRKLRVRSKVLGTADMPRMSVFRSNTGIYVQLIDDTTGKTLVAVSNEVSKLHKGKNKTEASFEVGKLVAEKALKAKITKAVFDRNGYKYHGRVKSLADGARQGGLVL